MKPMLICFLLFYFFVTGIHAQNVMTDSMPAGVSSVIRQYKDARGENLLLYNGVEYAQSYIHTTGHPFLFSDTFHTSSLVYDNVLYQNVLLNYNTVSNTVVIKNKDNFLIQLLNEKINSFTLDNRIFVSLSNTDIPKGEMQAGIYDWYPYSLASVFIRHQKIIERASNPADPDRFKSYTDFFIQNENKAFHIKNNKDLLKAFADQQGAVSSYLRQNHLTFKLNPEETVLQAAAYYAQLKSK